MTLDDGRTVFVKSGRGASARAQIEREGTIIEMVGAPFMPRVYGSASTNEWLTLVLEDLSDAQWPPPYPDGGRALLEAVARIGLSIRSTGATPPVVEFEDEAAYAALLAGSNAYNAAQPVDASIMRVSVLREGWLHDLQYALIWVCDLLGLPRPDEVA